MPGAVIRPLVEPVPVYPWAIVYRTDANYPQLAALSSALSNLAGKEGWKKAPEGAWMPRRRCEMDKPPFEFRTRHEQAVTPSRRSAA